MTMFKRVCCYIIHTSNPTVSVDENIMQRTSERIQERYLSLMVLTKTLKIKSSLRHSDERPHRISVVFL